MSLLTRLGRKEGQVDEPKQIFAGSKSETSEDAYQQLKLELHNRIIEEMSGGEQPMLVSGSADEGAVRELEERIAEHCQNILDENPFALPRSERTKIVADVRDEILGLGPIEPLLKDETVTEVMINGPRKIFVERMGKLQLTKVQFHDDTHLMNIIERILTPLGRRIDESSPMVDARLADGSRVNIIIPPLSLVGPCMTIRKFTKNPLSVENLVSFGTLNEDMAVFLRACVKARVNILVSGGTGSGKTTTLNVLSTFIPEDERIVTVEDAAELRLQQVHVVTLESRPANIEGSGAVTIRDLVRNALRMRPDRIIVGEVRSGEALTTAHANSPRDVLSRLETMVLMAGMELPVKAIREQISSAIDLIVQQSRVRDGSRKITYITEVQHMEGNTIILQDLFRYVQTGFDENGKALGNFQATGLRPTFMEKFQVNGVDLPMGLFDAAGRADEEGMDF